MWRMLEGVKRYYLGWVANGVPQSADDRDSSEVQNIAAMANFDIATNVSTHSISFDFVRSNLSDMAIGTPAILPQSKSRTPPKGNEGIIDVRELMYEQRAR